MKQFEVKRKQIEYISKALEVILFLIIERQLGLEGSGFFLIPLVIFYALWVFFGESLPDALGRIIRTRKSKGFYASVKQIRIMAFFSQLVTGALGSLIMLLLGTILGEKVFLCPYASLMIWVLSPLLFLRGMTYLFLGYCQGEGFELPAVVICIARLVITYFMGTFFGKMTGSHGEKVSALLKQEQYTSMYVAVGWCIAYVLAEVIMLLFVFFSFLGTSRKSKKTEGDSLRSSVSIQSYLSALYKNMGIKILIHFLEMFPILVSMMIFYHRENEKAPLTYATYFVGYFVIVLFAYYLMCSVIVPFWGRVYGHLKQTDKRLARLTFHGGIHLVIVLAGALSVTVAMLPAQVGGLAGFTSSNLVKIVVPGSLCILFMSLAFYFSRMMMRLKKNAICIIVAVMCDLLFLMIFLIFWKDEKMGLLALLYAGLITAVVYAGLLGAVAIPMIGGRINWIMVLWIPLLGVALMGGIQYVCVKFFGMYLKDLYMFLGVGLLGMFIYVCGLLIVRDFNEEELSLIPSGEILMGLGKLMGIYE